ncbi:peptidoglycan DD-metalloendopeptidase family protein [Desulfosarcina sp.]|uniref:peptidoglycan DD-metalloendopeptidase family protein n=1 Tax=Desulfosarcina sp. TaxID=2027861 RepID=UPI003970ADEF
MIFILPLPCLASGLQVKMNIQETPSPAIPPAAQVNVVEGTIRNRTLYEALTAYDIPPAEILSLSRSFAKVFDFRSSRPQDRYQVSVDDQNLIRKFVYKTSPLDEYEAIKEDDGGYAVRKRKIVLDRQMVAKVFTIETSLYQAVADSGETQQVSGMIADIFAWDIDFYLYPRKGDRIAVVYERCYKDGAFVQYGNVLAARYVGEQKTFSAFFFNDGKFDGYYDETGQPLKKMFLRTPLKFGKMTSAYSIRRFHPVSKRYKPHTGIDYGSPTGTPILATANGRVTFAGWKSGYGRLVIVKHPNGYLTYYGHCSRLLVKTGQLVEQGQTIARVGQTGVATGPHVHYEVRVNGKPINPDKVKKSRGNPLNPKLRDAFTETINDRLLLVENLLKEKTSLVMLTRDN